MKWVFNLWPSLPWSHITLDPDQLLDILEIFLREHLILNIAVVLWSLQVDEETQKANL